MASDTTTSSLRWRLESDAPDALFPTESLVERHVGTGEYRGLEFYEVAAKRVINEVPGASRMPFRFTINSYRGCSHACSYCVQGDTLVLLADGRTRRIAGRPAVLVGVDVPDARATWVLPGAEYNKGSYWRVYGTVVHYVVDGRAATFAIQSLISWRGQWYVVHLTTPP